MQRKVKTLIIVSILSLLLIFYRAYLLLVSVTYKPHGEVYIDTLKIEIHKLIRMLPIIERRFSIIGTRSSWPPSEPSEIISIYGKFVDLTLRPQVLNNSLTNEKHMMREIEILRKKYGNGGKYHSLLQEYKALTDIMQNKMGTMVSNYYDRYPQLIDILEVVKNITEGKAVSQVAMNDKPLYIIRKPSEKKCEEPLDLLILVKTISKNTEKREIMRNELMEQANNVSLKWTQVFMMGLPHSDTGRNITTTFVNSYLNGRAGNVLDEYKDPEKSSEIFKALLNESRTYKDLLIGSYYDSYYNLTAKCISGWRWTAQFCSSAKTIAIMDDDMRVNLKAMEKLINSWSKERRENFAGGTIWDSKQVTRPDKNPENNRWSLHEAEFPWDKFPPYFSGIMSLFGRETIRKMAIGSAFVQDIRIDDSFIGILLYKLRILSEHLPSISYLSYRTIPNRDDAISYFS